ncbi:hypothetical protein AALP_AA8G509400 [Arabis alpina]|uniref:Uncharacterized protein n=1 Tax=Arabis alpina TaxID=50452 RepID=A0A087GEU3_ARAAL|nr:hypothetical protein AALP_AA8G509400 [Arabis alpina]
MARTRTEEDEETLLLPHHNQTQNDNVSSSSSTTSEQEEEEEETLSLCDLPTKEKLQFPTQSKESDSEFEFEIGSSFRVGSDSCEPEMSTADELFFKGKILPFAELPGPTRLITRSESVEFRRTGIKPDRNNQNQIKNNFIDYSQPSPQPQIRRSSSMTARVNSIRSSKSSSIWDFLRLGLVRTPEIELRTGLNQKLSVSRNSSCSSTSSNSKKGLGESRSRNRRRSFLFSDCKCSVATETVVPTRISVSGESEIEKKKTAKKEEKSAIARKRTFEWLKDLSQVGLVVDHGRRSLV